MNNAVKNGYGEIVGFRCWRCGGVFQSMWGETCNGCRHQDKENAKLRAEVKKANSSHQKRPTMNYLHFIPLALCVAYVLYYVIKNADE